MGGDEIQLPRFVPMHTVNLSLYGGVLLGVLSPPLLLLLPLVLAAAPVWTTRDWRRRRPARGSACHI